MLHVMPKPNLNLSDLHPHHTYRFVIDAFPPNVRSRASGLIVGVSRVGGVVGVMLGGFLLDIDPSYTFYSSGGVLFAASAFFAISGRGQDRKPNANANSNANANANAKANANTNANANANAKAKAD